MRWAPVVLAVTLAAAGARAADAPAADPFARAASWLDRADAALADGRLPAAGEALAMAWLYAGSPVYDDAWRGPGQPARHSAVERWASGTARLAAARAWPDMAEVRGRARSASEAAVAARTAAPPREQPILWRAAAEASDECFDAARLMDLGDQAWPVPPAGETLGQLLEECAALRLRARTEIEDADRAAAERDAALRPLLKRDRLAIYLQLGEPACACADYAPRTVARAKEWVYVVGPTGALDTYETLTFTFRGDKLVGRHLRRTHDRP